MKTLVDIDDALLKKAMTLADTPTKKETIRRALEELIRAGNRQSLKALAGSGVVDMTVSELRRARRRGTR
ncbi:MAG: type II toxin-antitoxin system VapB family antitoxin [Nitrospirae bacterium]|nr:MAG: type II toxin-antitoxin system VapB family antitoxin [Nitrospirota bacterium]